MKENQNYKTEQVVEGEVVVIDFSEFKDLRKNNFYEEFEVGSLEVPSGQIVITDPLYLLTTTTLRRNISIGNYPVYLYFKNTDFGLRTCYAILEIQDTIPTDWEVALCDTTNLNDIEKKINGLFPVDTGLLSFSDHEVCMKYKESKENFAEENKMGNFYDDKLASEFAKNGNNPEGSGIEGDWLNYKLKNDNGNVILFSSGVGDGLYPAYWGLDEKGNPVQLVIDFMTLSKIEKYKVSRAE